MTIGSRQIAIVSHEPRACAAAASARGGAAGARWRAVECADAGILRDRSPRGGGSCPRGVVRDISPPPGGDPASAPNGIRFKSSRGAQAPSAARMTARACSSADRPVRRPLAGTRLGSPAAGAPSAAEHARRRPTARRAHGAPHIAVAGPRISAVAAVTSSSTPDSRWRSRSS